MAIEVNSTTAPTAGMRANGASNGNSRNAGAVSLSCAQERFWYLEQINPGDASLHVSRGVRLLGERNDDSLKEAFRRVVNHHEILRATFAASQAYASDGKPSQYVTAESKAELGLVDLSNLSGEERSEQLHAFAAVDAQRSFDLTLGPLLRGTLYGLSSTEAVLVLTAHRIVCDEYSLAILLRQVVETYDKLSDADLATLSVANSFSEFALKQRTDQALQQHVDFWRGSLAGAPALLELPTDRSRSASQNWHGASFTDVLDKCVNDKLHAIAASQQTTIEVLIMAAFQILLSRYADRTDVVIGTEFDNRDCSAFAQTVGPLSNFLPMRSDVSANQTFVDYLGHVSGKYKEAETHKALPFEKLLDELQVERSLSATPIFQVAYKVEKQIESRFCSKHLEVKNFEFDTGVSRFDLTLVVGPAAQTHLKFEYDTALFEQATIGRMARNFKVLLAAIATDPNTSIALLPLLTKEDLEQVLHTWNESDVDTAPAACMHEQFTAIAESHPDLTAIVCDRERITYGELNARANQLAHRLQTLGVGPEKLVGIYLERSIANVLAMVAILKAGGAYVPVDPNYPRDRVEFMMQDSNVTVLLTQKSLAANLPNQKVPQLLLDSDDFSSESVENPQSKTTPENLAYVIYTSGSTGRPKGVAITHETITHLFRGPRAHYGIGKGDVWTSVHSTGFDVSVWEIWGALLQPGRLVMVKQDVIYSPSALYDLLAVEGVTVFCGTPAVFRQLIESDRDLSQLKLRTIICGGDAIDAELAQQLAALPVTAWNGYGPTESTVWSIAKQIDARDNTTAALTSIGKRIPQLTTFILDSNLQPVPIGVAGEVFIGGAGLARGYLNRPELTAEKFIANPFAATPGERLYRTGDLGRHLPNGDIEYLGRLDNQVKLRGFRIELGEIETVLGQHPAVERAVVIIREDRPKDKRLVAYVVARETKANLTAELRKTLAEKLPDYMIPSAFVMLEALPLTPNQKVDRRSLPKPDDNRGGLESSYVAPRDNLEQQLANIWAKILDTTKIGVLDSFFELGGNSLLAVRLFAQIENRFGKRLPLATLFQSPTIEQLAQLLRNGDAKRAWSSLVAIQPGGSKPPLYCIHAAGANILIYRPLSQHLGNEQPVYALQARGLDGQQPPYLHVEDMAAYYIDEIRSFQPKGPYHLLGASFGGLVIFEMAMQLAAQGEKVGLLAMLNTNCPVYPRHKKVQFHLAHLKEYGPAFYSRALWQSLLRRLGKPTVSVNVGADVPDPQLARLVAERQNGDEALVRTVMAILDAEKEYVPRGKVFDGKITMFYAGDEQSDIEDNRLGWEKLASRGLDLHVVPGTHTSIREEPHVALLAEKLRGCLANC